MNIIIWNSSFLWKLNSRIYYVYDFKCSIFKCHPTPPLVQTTDWPMLWTTAFTLFCTSNTRFTSFHCNSVQVLPSVNFHYLSSALSNTAQTTVLLSLEFRGLGLTLLCSISLSFPDPPPTPSFNLRIRHINHQGKFSPM